MDRLRRSRAIIPYFIPTTPREYILAAFLAFATASAYGNAQHNCDEGRYYAKQLNQAEALQNPPTIYDYTHRRYLRGLNESGVAYRDESESPGSRIKLIEACETLEKKGVGSQISGTIQFYRR